MTGDKPADTGPAAAPGSAGGQASQETQPGPILDQHFDADSLYALRAAAEAHAAQAGMREGRRGDLVFVVSELAANAVRHGGGSGRLQMRNLDGFLQCQISDAGAAQPSHPGGAAAPAGQDQVAAWPVEHGHGLWVARQIADQLTLRSGPEGTTVTATFALPASRPSFRLTQHTRDGRTILELAGDLDQRSAPELTAALHALAADTPALRLVLDLTALSSWDSAGLAALITAQGYINTIPAATLTLAGVSSQLEQRLQALGLTS
jgi:anti-anti-sigma factor